MTKEEVKELVVSYNQNYDEQLKAIQTYLKTHPSVFIDTVMYDEFYGDYALCDENMEYRDPRTIKDYCYINVELLGHRRRVKAIGMTLNDNDKDISVWYMMDSVICDMPLSHVCKRDYVDLLWLLSEADDYEIAFKCEE